ncbi:MAG: amidase, partial [Nitrospinota bacterium]
MTEDLTRWTIGGLSEALRKRELSPVELTDTLLARIETHDPLLRAYITVDREGALAAAREAEEELAAGRPRGPLHGVPIAYKDLYETRGLRTTSGSKIYRDHLPAEDATSVARLREAGAVCLGKLNMHEFAFGPTGLNAHYGNARNPWDPERIAGGSSSGSGSAVAALLALAALGTDTGGSIRIPAACCGVVGLKPTYGRVSRAGVVPLSWSMDHVGPLARCAEDAALLLDALAGHDPRDPTSSRRPVPHYRAALGEGLDGLRVGVPRSYFFEALDPEVEAALERALGHLQAAGAGLEEVSFPHIEEIQAGGYVILLSEAAAFHTPLMDERGEDYDPSVRSRLEEGRFFLATDYIHALQVRPALTRAVLREVFGRVDVVATPTLPILPPPIGATEVEVRGRRYDAVASLIRFTRPANYLGFPALSLPCGWSAGGLPVGLQLLGLPRQEGVLLRAAHAYEVASG